MHDQPLAQATSEKDLGITVDDQLKFTSHINSISSKASRTLGFIKRNFKHLDEDSFITLYKTKVRPTLEYASPVWSPQLTKDKMKLERIQARFTKIIPKYRHLPYPERLRRLGIPSLEYRRLRADLIEVYKVLHNLTNINPLSILPPTHTTSTRGHSLKLTKERPRTSTYGNSLRYRIIDCWNALPDHAVTAPSINSFKNRLNIALKNHPLKFSPSSY